MVQRLRQSVYSSIAQDQPIIMKLMRGDTFQFKPDRAPDLQLRIFDLWFSIYNSYGENEISEKSMRDLMKEQLPASPCYRALTDWCVMNPGYFQALSYTQLKSKIISAYVAHFNMGPNVLKKEKPAGVTWDEDVEEHTKPRPDKKVNPGSRYQI